MSKSEIKRIAIQSEGKQREATTAKRAHWEEIDSEFTHHVEAFDDGVQAAQAASQNEIERLKGELTDRLAYLGRVRTDNDKIREERDQLRALIKAHSEPVASSECPICGVDTPHSHEEQVVTEYHADQIRGDGWNSMVKCYPKEDGWYLCLGVKINMPDQDQYDFSQYSWLKWVRDFLQNGWRERNLPCGIPEVLYFDKSSRMFCLRNALGNSAASGIERRRFVYAQIKYWREVPPLYTYPIKEK